MENSPIIFARGKVAAPTGYTCSIVYASLGVVARCAKLRGPNVTLIKYVFFPLRTCLFNGIYCFNPICGIAPEQVRTRLWYINFIPPLHLIWFLAILLLSGWGHPVIIWPLRHFKKRVIDFNRTESSRTTEKIGNGLTDGPIGYVFQTEALISVYLVLSGRFFCLWIGLLY